MLVPWLEKLIIVYAGDLSRAGSAVYQFEKKIEELLRRSPIQEWEADRWLRGIKMNLIKGNGHFYRVGSGKNSAISLFVRNETGLNVGLRRESITQMATFVSLITDYGYSRSRVRFESKWMDVVVYDRGGEAVIYAENKATEKIMRKLCARLETEFVDGVPYVSKEEREPRKTDDAVMKAQHIKRNRPLYFWAVSPTARQSYSLNYSNNGFSLNMTDDIPNESSLRLSVRQAEPVY